MGYIRWSAQQTEQFKRLVKARLSAAQIAHTMGIDVSRVHSKAKTEKVKIAASSSRLTKAFPKGKTAPC